MKEKRLLKMVLKFLCSPKGYKIYVIICAWIITVRLACDDICFRRINFGLPALLFYGLILAPCLFYLQFSRFRLSEADLIVRKLKKDMLQSEVRRILGEPDNETLMPNNSGYEWDYKNVSIFFNTRKIIIGWQIQDTDAKFFSTY